MKSIINNTHNNKKKTSRKRKSSLKAVGMRMTSQRALILQIIQEGQGHLDADEIFRRARYMKPRLSLSTVYRTLKALKKPGMIDELHFDDTHRHYEAKSSKEHHHLVCLGCGRVIEFTYPLSRYLRRNIVEAKDFEITETEIRMKGYCPRCQQGR